MMRWEDTGVDWATPPTTHYLPFSFVPPVRGLCGPQGLQPFFDQLDPSHLLTLLLFLPFLSLAALLVTMVISLTAESPSGEMAFSKTGLIPRPTPSTSLSAPQILSASASSLLSWLLYSLSALLFILITPTPSFTAPLPPHPHALPSGGIQGKCYNHFFPSLPLQLARSYQEGFLLCS